MNRRKFLGATLAWPLSSAIIQSHGAADAGLEKTFEANRPSRLPGGKWRDFAGATHVGGKYHLTSRPFLLEGADKLLELGTRVGKFWFISSSVKKDYPWNSEWPQTKTFVDLARTPYFDELFRKPFRTIILEAHTDRDNGWKSPQPASFYEKLSGEFQMLTEHLYTTYSQQDVTFILQNWEGDWLLRGRGGDTWNPAPPNAKELCEQMQKWLRARQQGVTRGRQARKPGSKCEVYHAAEVNRVADAWKGIPTMVRDVLPGVPLDMVSYSCYDGMKDPLTLWRCLEEIRKQMQVTGVARGNPLYIGEIGIPENEQPDALEERWDQWMGVAITAKVRHVVHWELYCNEPAAKTEEKPPMKRAKSMRGFWLVKPDGTLSSAGHYFTKLWARST